MDETVKFLDTMREILAKESIDQSKHIFIGRNKKTQNSIKISLSSKDFDHKLNEWKYVYLMSQTKNHIKYENDSKELLKETEAIIQSLASDEASDICLRINDSIKANYQRHESAAENLEEIHNLLNKIIQQKENYKNFTLSCNSTNPRKFS